MEGVIYMNDQSIEVVKDINDLPIMLNAKQVQSILGISRSATYNLLNSDRFPRIRLGSRIVVPRAELIKWLDQQLQLQLSPAS
jgi:predicted DNA-binding transcriptional regulator AlpA